MEQEAREQGNEAEHPPPNATTVVQKQRSPRGDRASPAARRGSTCTAPHQREDAPAHLRPRRSPPMGRQHEVPQHQCLPSCASASFEGFALTILQRMVGEAYLYPQRSGGRIAHRSRSRPADHGGAGLTALRSPWRAAYRRRPGSSSVDCCWRPGHCGGQNVFAQLAT